MRRHAQQLARSPRGGHDWGGPGNGLGIAGVDKMARMQPVRALGTCFGWSSDVSDAIRWAAGLSVPGVPDNPTPAQVVNLSLGGSGACPSIEQLAIDDAVVAGAVVVAAAGNSASDLDSVPFSPASCNNVIAVAATTRFGDRANYSNFGSIVDIAAPGGWKPIDEGIVSLSNAGTTNADLSQAGWTYATKQGTSMAVPHVSGVISLMLAANDRLPIPNSTDPGTDRTTVPHVDSRRGVHLLKRPGRPPPLRSGFARRRRSGCGR